MADFIIYRDRSMLFNDEAFLRSFCAKYRDTNFCSQNLEEFRSKMLAEHPRICIIMVLEALSKELEDFLAKTKHHIHLHDSLLIILHAKMNGIEVQRSLMLGADYVFHEPVSAEFLASIVEHHLSGAPLAIHPSYDHFATPINCQIDIFGRVGRITKKPLGDLYIESNLDFKIGDNIKLLNLISVDMHSEEMLYEVLEKSTSGLYYRYSYLYQLKWLCDESQRKMFQLWINDHQKNFSFPKAKVLFVFSKDKIELLNDLNGEIFSTYFVIPKQFNSQILKRLDPQIIVHEQLSDGQERFLQEWSLQKSVEKKNTQIIGKKFMAEFSDKEDFRERFMKEVEPFLRSNFKESIGDFHYISRKSAYSRFAVSMEAKIWSISNHHMLIQCRQHFSMGSVLQLHLPMEAEAPSLLFLKVIEEPVAMENGWKYTCLICCFPDEQRTALFNMNQHWVSRNESFAELGAYEAQKDRIGFLGTDRRKPLQRILVTGGILIFIFLGFALAILHSRQYRTTSHDASVTDYESFQKSVKKAFDSKDQR